VIFDLPDADIDYQLAELVGIAGALAAFGVGGHGVCVSLPCGRSCPQQAWEGDLAAYLVVEHTIAEPARFEEYRAKVAPIIAKHGGRYLTKGGSPKLLESGRRPPDRVMIIEFPDMGALDAFYTAPEYQPLIPLRQSAVQMDAERKANIMRFGNSYLAATLDPVTVHH